MRYDVAVYNVGPVGKDGRGLPVLKREAHAIASTGPKVILFIETIGWGPLFELPGYRKFRDRTTEGRANLTVYVRDGLTVGKPRWHAMTKTWRQTRDGAGPNDRHWPREILELTIGDGQWLFSHDPPLSEHHDTGPARQEHQALLRRRMAPELRPDWDGRSPEDRKRALARMRVNLGDPNGLGDDLAKAIGGWYAGSQIEGGTVRGGHWTNARTQPSVGGVVMGSDHHRVFLGTVVDDRS